MVKSETETKKRISLDTVVVVGEGHGTGAGNPNVILVPPPLVVDAGLGVPPKVNVVELLVNACDNQWD